MKTNKGDPKISKPFIKSPNLFPVVGIGASAGGLDAFKKLLKAIPENSGVAYVLVQHLDPSHESMLPDLLQKVTKVPVLEITDDIKVQPDHIYVIPSNKIMVATDGVLLLAPRPPKSKNEPNLPIDLFFSSLAEVHQSHAIGVVLSGTGSDGTRGLKVIKDHGGITFAQDEESAAYEGMPHSAVQADVVDFILSPEKIPQKILEVNKSMNGYGGDEQTLPQQEEDVFKQIISLLRIRRGTDFTYYKQTNIRRRILRRMALNKNLDPATYLKYLRENKPEQDVLYQDLLIPVTSFFRDPKSFDNLCEMVFPLIIKNKAAGEPIRLWVAGCSTGQEAYSIAICFKEFLGDNQQRVQIFATDLSEPAIAKARIGIYAKNEVDDVTAQRLHEFFTKINGSYQVNKNIRDMCVFAVHNFLKDPPFGKIDFIGCRNVLIYMEPYLQKKALTTFHYSLNPKGFLLLGKSETTSSVPDLFASAVKSDKLFSRKDVPGRFIHVVSQRGEQDLSPAFTSPKNETIRSDFHKSADDIILSKYTPAGVVVNETMDIMHFRGNTGSYLGQSPGKPSHNLLKMAKQGLAFELRNILHKVKKEKAPVIKENIPLQVNNSLRNISIEAIPLPNTIEPHYLILFHDKESSVIRYQSSVKKTSSGKTKNDDKDLRIQQLEKELEQVHEDMRGITEEQEAANEELQSANEELLSGSEELQSLNEELETSKEELESTNEELTVVNHEIISLNEQVTEARDYAEAIVASIRTPLLVLDKNLRIKSANLAFYKIFQTLESETEGKLIYDLGNSEWDIASLRTLLEHILPEKSKIVDYEMRHTFKSIGDRTMLLNAHEIKREVGTEKLILLAIQDITAERTAAEKIKESEQRYNMMLMQSPFAFAVLKGKDMMITLANDSIKEIWGKGKDVEDKPLLEILPELKDQPFPALLDKVYTTGIPFYEYEILARLQRNGKSEDVYFNLIYQPYFEADKTISGVTVIAYEVTVEVMAKKRIEDSEKQFRQMAELMPQKVWTADAQGNKNYFNQKWLDYTGLPFEELKDWGWKKIIHPDDWEETKKRWQQSINTGKDYEMENRLLGKDGKYLWHLTRAIALKDENSKIKIWIGSKTEIDTMKAEELRKGDFIKMVSHELKTPVTSIKGYVQLLLMMLEDEHGKQDTLQIKDSLTRIDRQIVKLTRLIAEMLDLSRIEADRLELQTELFSINKLVIETIEDFRYTNSKHTIDIYQDFSCAINGDKDRIEQVIINFVANAIKYSPDNSQIEVRIQEAEKNQVAVSVKDRGIGIDNTEHQKIFERFYRVGGKSEQTYPGFGIGLFIANEIIERHNGFITIKSKKGEGSVFTFTLPVAPENKI